MSKVKGVLFDKDGVLVDFHATWGPATVKVLDTLSEGDAALKRALADAVDFDLDAGRHRPQSVFIAGASRDLVDAWQPLLPSVADRSLQKHLASLFTDAGYEHAVTYADVAAALTELGQMRLPLGVATNDEEISARKQLGKIELAGRFSFVVGADSGHGPKPGPGMLLAYAEHIEVDPANIVMVGDSTHDLHAARAAGMIGVGIGTGPATLADLAPHADHTIQAMAELPALIASL